MNHPNTKDLVEVLHGNTLKLGDGLTVSFQRTLRIPDDGRSYPLPPGLGAFPLRRVEDYASRVPDAWRAKGGVFLPMYQREAMWLCFSGSPHALKVGVGKVCAISGERWREGLGSKPQNYVVPPNQPWLDGIASGKGTIRQFVAMPLGAGYTVEAQVTGEEKEGGIQLQAFPPRPGVIRTAHFDGFDSECSAALPPPMMAGSSSDFAPAPASAKCALPSSPRKARSAAVSMGLAAGGRMTQKIYPDPWGLEAWDQTATRTRVFVHLANSELWKEITGEDAPPTPVTAKAYAQAGLPWYALYDEHASTLSPTDVLSGIKSIKELDEEPVQPLTVKTLPGGGLFVKDGNW